MKTLVNFLLVFLLILKGGENISLQFNYNKSALMENNFIFLIYTRENQKEIAPFFFQPQ
jgi:hypothetical protein